MTPSKVDKGVKGVVVARLGEALEAECRLTADLVAALKQEAAGIISGQVEELYAACARRSELTERLAASQEATAEAIRAAGGEEPRDLSGAILLLHRSERPKLRRLREEINRLRREVAALSEGNRRCVADALEYIDGTLAILTGVPTTADGYGGAKAKAGPAVLSSEV